MNSTLDYETKNIISQQTNTIIPTMPLKINDTWTAEDG